MGKTSNSYQSFRWFRSGNRKRHCMNERTHCQPPPQVNSNQASPVKNIEMENLKTIWTRRLEERICHYSQSLSSFLALLSVFPNIINYKTHLVYLCIVFLVSFHGDNVTKLFLKWLSLALIGMETLHKLTLTSYAAVDCGPLRSFPKTVLVSDTTSTYLSKATYSCQGDQWLSVGVLKRTVTCSANGAWQPVPSSGCTGA